jgi:hypothetical protein
MRRLQPRGRSGQLRPEGRAVEKLVEPAILRAAAKYVEQTYQMSQRHTKPEDLRSALDRLGLVISAIVVPLRLSTASRWFALVDMEDGRSAMEAMIRAISL